ncbi:ABC transporter substrate-binding protein [Tsukamurella sp. 8F]|uniref:ABC transporter substrate-binding protein n=1 Tax=unclassified Tsukamurella TaxID=2633480 RepID=UPI0023B90FEB|nr:MULTISPECIES: ABC transporter substrate-binding protein [unclassified Tsukamurella]MDF0529794.1 ABC transporter substrate-binding protein [Tsukamurella sp. 8J]MDF0586986.1 ABC transporter substrate-binding protein [Tsukamurella sp. 8F]
MTMPDRRLFRCCALALVATAAVAACGRSVPDDAAAPRAAGSGFPVTVTSSAGSVTIEHPPQRIVALTDAGFENVLAFGEQPVAASVKYLDALPYLADHRNDKAIDPSLGDYMTVGVEVEAVAAHKPDLIIAPAWVNLMKFKDQLSRIAPTLFFDALGSAPDWREGVEQVGAALGKSGRAKELVAAAEEKYRALASRHPGLARTTYSFGLARSGAVTLGTGGAVLRLSGLKPAADQEEVERTRKVTTYSAETVTDIDGRVVLLMARPQAERSVFEAMPVWSAIAPRVVWLSDAQGEAINNAGYLGKAWLPGSLDAELGRVAQG